jgi:hypothetical protein
MGRLRPSCDSAEVDMTRMLSALGLFRRYAWPLLAVLLFYLLLLGFRLALPELPRHVLAPDIPWENLVAFSPDGAALILIEDPRGLGANPLACWFPAQRPDAVRLQGSESLIGGADLCYPGEHIVFSPDNEFVAAGTSSHLLVWESLTGNRVADLPRLESDEVILQLTEKLGASDFRFTPDGRYLLYAYQRRGDPASPTLALRCRDLRSNADRPLPGADSLWGLAFAADGKSVLLVREGEKGKGKLAVLWRLTGEADVATSLAEYPVGEGKAVACTADLSAFATLSYPDACPGLMTINVWDTRAGTVRASFGYPRPSWKDPHSENSDPIHGGWKPALLENTFSFSPGGGFLVIEERLRCRSRNVCSKGINEKTYFREATLWDIRSNPVRIGPIKLDLETCSSPIFSNDDRRILLATSFVSRTGEVPSLFARVDLLEADTLRRCLTLAEGEGEIAPSFRLFGGYPPLWFSPNGNTVALVTWDEFQSGPFLRWLSEYIPQFTTEGRIWVIRICEVESGKELAAYRNGQQALFTPDGQSMAVMYTGGRVAIWDAPPQQSWPRLLGWAGLCWAVAVLLFWGLRRTWLRRARLDSVGSSHILGR